MAPFLKTGVGETPPWVRIHPPHPPTCPSESVLFIRLRRIFPLFSRVMWEGLSTSPSAVRPVSRSLWADILWTS